MNLDWENVVERFMSSNISASKLYQDLKNEGVLMEGNRQWFVQRFYQYIVKHHLKIMLDVLIREVSEANFTKEELDVLDFLMEFSQKNGRKNLSGE